MGVEGLFDMSTRELLTRNPFTIAWIVWVISFFLIEYGAIWSDVPGSTLSAHIRSWLAAGGWWRLALFGVFFAWLIPHLMWGLKR